MFQSRLIDCASSGCVSDLCPLTFNPSPLKFCLSVLYYLDDSVQMPRWTCQNCSPRLRDMVLPGCLGDPYPGWTYLDILTHRGVSPKIPEPPDLAPHPLTLSPFLIEVLRRELFCPHW